MSGIGSPQNNPPSMASVHLQPSSGESTKQSKRSNWVPILPLASISSLEGGVPQGFKDSGDQSSIKRRIQGKGNRDTLQGKVFDLDTNQDVNVSITREDAQKLAKASGVPLPSSLRDKSAGGQARVLVVSEFLSAVQDKLVESTIPQVLSESSSRWDDNNRWSEAGIALKELKNLTIQLEKFVEFGFEGKITPKETSKKDKNKAFKGDKSKQIQWFSDNKGPISLNWTARGIIKTVKDLKSHISKLQELSELSKSPEVESQIGREIKRLQGLADTLGQHLRLYANVASQLGFDKEATEINLLFPPSMKSARKN